MVKRIITVLIATGVMGCARMGSVPPEMLQKYQGRTLYTCCNIHYESSDVSDANYYVGALLPAGSAAQVQGLKPRSVTFTADGHPLTLTQSYGTAQETFEVYLDKVLVADDPKGKLATWPKAVQDAVRQSHVEVGMTRDQVIMSLGYPPTHRTPSLNDTMWTYWYNRWVTYQVVFDATGKVQQVVGSPSPTTNTPIPPEPASRSAPAPSKSKKHK
jgi:hypothetical protein